MVEDVALPAGQASVVDPDEVARLAGVGVTLVRSRVMSIAGPEAAPEAASLP